MQVSQRHTGVFGIQYATTPTGTKLLDNQGKDAVGNKYLTAGQRAATMQDGYQKASGLGNQINDSIHRGQAAAANQRASATYNNAAANGNITKLEQRNINSANRDAGVANKQVQVDNARTHLGNVKVAAARDGKITPCEQGNINAAQGNLNRLTGELNTLKANDARMDRSDARHNTVGAQVRSSIQDAVGVGRKVAPTWGGPAAGIPRPSVSPHGGCMFHHGGSVGASSSRLSNHIAQDHGHLRLTNSAGYASNGSQYLNAGQRASHMAHGAAQGNYRMSDAIHQNQASQAHQNLHNTYSSARADGRVGMFEQRNINDAKRNVGVADQQVAVDTQRRHVGHLEQRFSADGKITPRERYTLNTERGKLTSMTNELNNLKAQDASADRADAAFKSNPFNRFANALGIGSRPAHIGASGLARAAGDAAAGLAQTASIGAQGLARAAGDAMANFAQNFRPMPLPMPQIPRPPFGGLLGGITSAIGGAMGAIGGAVAGIAGALVPPPPMSLIRPAILAGASFSSSSSSSFSSSNFGGSFSSSSTSSSSYSSSSWGNHGSYSSSAGGSSSFAIGGFKSSVSWNSNVSIRY